MKRVKKTYITFLVGCVNNKGVKMDCIPGFALSKVMYENLCYLKDNKTYIEHLDKFFSYKNSEGVSILLLNANFEIKIGNDEIYRIRIEVDFSDVSDEELIKEIVVDIFTVLEFGMDIVLNEYDRDILKLLYINNSFKFYEIDFMTNENTKNLEKLLSFSWEGLRFDKLDGNDICNNIEQFYSGKRLEFDKFVIKAKFEYKNKSIIKSINFIKNEFKHEMINIVKDMNGHYEVIEEYFHNCINFDIDLKTNFFNITLVKYKDIDYLIGILLIILKDAYNGLYIIDDNMCFENVNENLLMMGKTLDNDIEEKYLKKFYEFCNYEEKG